MAADFSIPLSAELTSSRCRRAHQHEEVFGTNGDRPRALDSEVRREPDCVDQTDEFPGTHLLRGKGTPLPNFSSPVKPSAQLDDSVDLAIQFVLRLHFLGLSTSRGSGHHYPRARFCTNYSA
jgi:hypothetical protein